MSTQNVNSQNINLNKFQVGAKKSMAKTAEQKLLFESLDTNDNGIIDNWEAKGVVKGKIKDKNGKLVEKEYIKIKDLPNGRSLVINESGKQYIRAKDGTILEQEYAEKQIAAENEQRRKKAEVLADKFYKIADDNAGINSMKKMQDMLDKEINRDNISAFLDAYDRDKTKHGDSSIIDTITSEVGAGGSAQQKKVLTTILDKLCEAAKAVGVANSDITRARKDFLNSMNKEMDAVFRRTNPKDMEKALDFLRGAIAAKQTKDVQNISQDEAINKFNKTNQTKKNEAQTQYDEAKGEDWSWTAKAGDTICGWLGCNTIEDLETKLGDNAKDAIALNNAAEQINEAKTPQEKQTAINNFKRLYKKTFEIDFDKNKIAAYEAAKDNHKQALNLNSVKNITSELINNSKSMKDKDFEKKIMESFQYDQEQLETIINNYGLVNKTDTSIPAKRREMLMLFLTETNKNSTLELNKITNGKTIEQMGKDVDLITRSAFGTKDIVKDVIQFNENIQTTEMVTEAAFEIAGTIALQFVPGMGQAAAARLAVNAARWGTKAVKVANAAAKAEKTFAAVAKFQKGEAFAGKVASKTAQIGSQMATAGIATATVDLSNGDDVKATMKKTLMNMSFSGVGAGSSMLAPKLMKAFGITNKALANEIAEEIINAAGSYGITTVAGDEYGSSDALVDFASGLVISRLSHVGGSKPTPKTNEKSTIKPKIDETSAKPQNIREDVGTNRPNSTRTENHITTESTPAWKISLAEQSREYKIGNNSSLTLSGDRCILSVNGKAQRAYRLNAGEQKIISTDSKGNNIVLNRDANGKYTVSAVPETKTKTQNITNSNQTKPVWQISIVSNNTGYKLGNNLSLNLSGDRCILSVNGKAQRAYRLNAGEQKIISTDSKGNNIVLNRDANGKYTVSAVPPETSSAQTKTVTSQNNNPPTNRTSDNTTTNHNRSTADNPEQTKATKSPEYRKMTDVEINRKTTEINDKMENIKRHVKQYPDLGNRLDDLKTTLSGIDDPEVFAYIKSELDNLESMIQPRNGIYYKFNEKTIGLEIENLQTCVDAVHTIKGDYVYLGSKKGELYVTLNNKSYTLDFVEWAKKNDPEFAKAVLDKNNNSSVKISAKKLKTLQKDFELSQKYERMIKFCAENPNASISNHLYENYMLKMSDIPEKLKKELLDMNKQYNVKVFPSSDLSQADNVMNYLKTEFNEWKTKSKGTAKMPPTIDFLNTKSSYFDKSSAYGQGETAAFSNSHTGSLSFCSMNLYDVHQSIRHEMTHSNDLKNLMNSPSDVFAYKNIKYDTKGNIIDYDIDLKNCKLVEDMRKLGLSEFEIEYAYNNPSEFIAIASEGDLSKCTPRLKVKLLEYGMPEFMFNMIPKKAYNI